MYVLHAPRGSCCIRPNPRHARGVGQEIVYCYRCQIRLTGADLDKGKGFQAAGRVSCAACAPHLIGELSGRDREMLLASMAKDRRPPPARPETPRTGSRKIPAPAPAKSALGLTVGIGAVALVGSLLIALSGGGRRPPPTPPEPEVAAKPKPVVVPSRADLVAKELAVLDAELRGPLDRADYKQALAHLQAAAARRSEAEWAVAVEERMRRVREASAPPPEKVFQQGVDGLLVIEAEHFSKKIDRGDQAWTPQSVAGAVAMQALPDRNSPIQNDYAPRSPELQYLVRFTRAGTYYVWIRGLGPDDAANSAHLGLDGAALPGLADLQFSASGKWAWTKTKRDKSVAAFEIPSPGQHVLNLWMREDGTCIDRLVITPNEKFAPEREGPPESQRLP